jgi:hypothetical protein
MVYKRSREQQCHRDDLRFRESAESALLRQSKDKGKAATKLSLIAMAQLSA